MMKDDSSANSQKPLSVKQARRKLLHNLSKYGIKWNRKDNRLEVADIRDAQKRLAAITNMSGMRYQPEVAQYFASSDQLAIDKVRPYLVALDGREDIFQKIWSYALSFWSVPVSAGYGRRMRYLVFDKQNDKLIGLFGLCDPLIGSNIRDEYIGWNREQKHDRLYNCLTAYILGAVPPYNQILGSKLVALTSMFPEVRRDFYWKYRDNKTIISDKKRLPYLVCIDTYGAFQKSAIYTRLLNWEFVGYTQGQSHVHITANGSWDLIRQFVPDKHFESYSYGQGSNWKMRTLKLGLSKLGFGEDMLGIGWKRAYYLCPLAANWKEFLLGNHRKPKFIENSSDDLVNYWYERWVNPRLDTLHNKLFSMD